ncbi:MAG: hypothetical protein L0Z50_32740, partial [Verrucomicrobiales bacterium]|nr:hypothetical protein [Verrucomicrobiales bacterium]
NSAEVAGAPLTNPINVPSVRVTEGAFTVTLDFGGVAIFDGSPRYLEIGVSKGGSPYSTLDPRQKIASIPYAITSISAATAATALNVASGSAVKSLNNLKDNVILAGAGPITITPNGNTLTIGSTATGGGGGGSGLWSLAGTDAYYNAGNVGIGTSTPANKLTVRTPTLGYGLEHTDGDIRLSTFVGRAKGYLGTLSNHKLTFFANDNGFPNMTMTLDTAGAVGLGTDSPTAGIRLEVIGATLLKPGNGNIQFGSPNVELGMSIIPNTGNRADLRFSGSTLKLVAGPGPGPPPPENGIAISTSGNVGIGSPFPTAKLEVVAQDALRLIGYQPFLTLSDANAGYARSRIQTAGGEMILAPESYLIGTDPNAYVKLFNSGNVSVKTLTIRGGADLAEPFELSATDIAKGSVVIIDDEQPGKLKLSKHAYDTRVAGIVSGANGVNPGISLQQDGVLEGGQNVALSGRGYVLADAANGPIKPGDLLTTSDTPGHAMKVGDPNRAQGAILGKAMTALKEERGLVLVLVTLQ